MDLFEQGDLWETDNFGTAHSFVGVVVRCNGKVEVMSFTKVK